MEEYFKDLTFYVSRPETLQRDELCYYCSRFPGLETKVVTIPLDHKNREIYIGKKFGEEFDKQLFHNIDSEEKFKKHIEDYVELSKDYDNYLEVLKATKKDKKEIAERYETFLEKYYKLSPYVRTPFVVEKVFDGKVYEQLTILHQKDFECMYQAISSPTELHEYQKIRLAICRAVIDNVEINKAAKDLTDQYGWYGEYSYIEPLLDENHFKAEINKLTPESAKTELEKINSDIKNNIEQFQKALVLIKDPKLNLYARIVNKYVFLRTDRLDIFKKLQSGTRHLLDLVTEFLMEETGKDWKREDVAEMSKDEIMDFLSKNIIPDLDYIRDRAKNYVFVKDDKMTKVISDKDEVARIVDIVKKLRENSNVVKGKVAFRGKIKGKVALVLKRSDLSKVDTGSVLVARTTMIDYIHAMEKALAFVTEEGGITSHAAIVSRELKKPCIVGTGNATKVLKDGDMVEVDADAGVVKIIK